MLLLLAACKSNKEQNGNAPLAPTENAAETVSEQTTDLPTEAPTEAP